MDADQQFHMAWARFNALRSHPPSKWGEAEVKEYHGALDALEAAYSGEDLGSFRVPADEPQPVATGFARGTRRAPGQTFYSQAKFCKTETMERRIQGVANYFQSSYPEQKTERAIGFKPE